MTTVLPLPSFLASLSAHQALLTRQTLGGAERLLVGDNIDLVVDLTVEDIGNDAVADAHLQVCADGAAGENRRVFRLDRPDLDGGILRLEHLADAR